MLSLLARFIPGFPSLTTMKVVFVIVACAGCFAAGVSARGWVVDRQERKAWELTVQNLRAQQVKSVKILEDQIDEQKSINSTLSTDLERVRDRAKRMQRPTAVDCSGSDGRTLSDVDAGFLVRYAAIAARQQAALKSCYAQYDAVRGK